MSLVDMRVSDFLAAIRSPNPTPGGGSAAALAGAIGASLLARVAAMPSRRAATEEDVERLQTAAARCTELSEHLATLVDRDSAAYDQVVAAYRLPKATDAEKAERTRTVQQALAAAVEAPLAVMRRSSEAIEAAPVIAAFGNPNAASDVGVALELLIAASRGARLNIEINLGSVKDAAYVSRVKEAAATLDAECVSGANAARARLAEGG